MKKLAGWAAVLNQQGVCVERGDTEVKEKGRREAGRERVSASCDYPSGDP